MILLTAIAIGALFGAGIYAMAHRDVIKLTGGTLLISNAAVLFLMAATFRGGEAPILPVDRPGQVADPLVQALALTAIVITFGTAVLLLRVALAIEETHATLSMDDLARAEIEKAEEDAAAHRPKADEPAGDGPDRAGGGA